MKQQELSSFLCKFVCFRQTQQEEATYLEGKASKAVSDAWASEGISVVFLSSS